MEIAKKLIILYLIINCIETFGQKDTIRINIDTIQYKKIVYTELEKRYDFTFFNKDTINKIFTHPETFLLTKYPKIDLIPYYIPLFKFKDTLINNKNIVYNIDFSNDFSNIIYNIYYKNKDILFSDVIFNQNLDFNSKTKFEFSLIGYNFEKSSLLGIPNAELIKLGMEKKHFAFYIEDFMDVLFIIDKGVIYAIYNVTYNGCFEKAEINEYFSKAEITKRIKKRFKGYWNKKKVLALKKTKKTKYYIKLL